MRRTLGEFGDDGVVHVSSFRQMADQRLEELLAGAAGRAFDYGLERPQVVPHGRR